MRLRAKSTLTLEWTNLVYVVTPALLLLRCIPLLRVWFPLPHQLGCWQMVGRTKDTLL